MKYLSSVYTLKFLILLTSLFWYMEGKYYTQFSMEPEIHSFIHSFIRSFSIWVPTVYHVLGTLWKYCFPFYRLFPGEMALFFNLESSTSE